MRADADEGTVNRHLEAYLLWLFGYVMFCGSQGDAVTRYLIPYARMIADAPLAEVPQISWGAAVLAATFRGLCMAVAKGSKDKGILLGCPLLLQLWSYERLPVGRPSVDRSPYHYLPAAHDDVDRPTMGSLWCLRKVMNVSLHFLDLFPL